MDTTSLWWSGTPGPSRSPIRHTSYRYLLRRAGAGRLGIQVMVGTSPQP